MKIEIKKIIRPLYLRNFSPEYGDVALQVWVNPPRFMMEQRSDQLVRAAWLSSEMKNLLVGEHDPERMKAIALELEKIGDEVIVWLAEVWSQGPEETRMSVDELKAFVEDASENDPRLYAWMLSETFRMIADYRSTQKKS